MDVFQWSGLQVSPLRFEESWDGCAKSKMVQLMQKGRVGSGTDLSCLVRIVSRTELHQPFVIVR